MINVINQLRIKIMFTTRTSKTIFNMAIVKCFKDTVLVYEKALVHFYMSDVLLLNCLSNKTL